MHAFKADVAFARTSLAAEPAPAATPEVTAEVTESATETVPEPVETAKTETDEEEVIRPRTGRRKTRPKNQTRSSPIDTEKTAHVPELAEADAVTGSAEADKPGHTELLAAIAELRKTFLETGSAETDKSGHIELLAAIAEMQKTFAAAAMAMKEDVKEQVNELTTRVDLVAALAQKTDAALNGTVFNEAGGDRPGRIAKTAVPINASAP